jgi:ADP-ribose pyrophosphatase
MSPGILDEHMHVFIATGLTLGDPSREFGEQIENFPATLDEIDNLIMNGKLVDAKSITAILYYLRYAREQ